MARDAERAIPDKENAAFEYKTLLNDYGAALQLPETLDDANNMKIETTPWRSVDHPDTAQWLKKKQPVIDGLLAIGRMEKCVFPLLDSGNGLPALSDFLSFSPYSKACRNWAFLLRYAIYHDLGEGYVTEAITKAQTMQKIANHLIQQPDALNGLIAMSIENMRLRIQADIIVDGLVSDQDLVRLANDSRPTEKRWREHHQEAEHIDRLIHDYQVCTVSVDKIVLAII